MPDEAQTATRTLPENRIQLDLEMPGPRLYVARLEPYRISALDRLLADPKPDIPALKAAMVAAHPDKGGSAAAFIKARAKYVAARRMRRTAR